MYFFVLYSGSLVLSGGEAADWLPPHSAWPLASTTCCSCSQAGYFKRCQKSKPPSSASVVSGTVMTVVAHVTHHPSLLVFVFQAKSRPLSMSVSMVADTSAMMCMAGITLLQDLHQRQLEAHRGLQDVANKQFQCLRFAPCYISAVWWPQFKMSICRDSQKPSTCHSRYISGSA